MNRSPLPTSSQGNDVKIFNWLRNRNVSNQEVSKVVEAHPEWFGLSVSKAQELLNSFRGSYLEKRLLQLHSSIGKEFPTPTVH